MGAPRSGAQIGDALAGEGVFIEVGHRSYTRSKGGAGKERTSSAPQNEPVRLNCIGTNFDLPAAKAIILCREVGAAVSLVFNGVSLKVDSFASVESLRINLLSACVVQAQPDSLLTLKPSTSWNFAPSLALCVHQMTTCDVSFNVSGQQFAVTKGTTLEDLEDRFYAREGNKLGAESGPRVASVPNFGRARAKLGYGNF